MALPEYLSNEILEEEFVKCFNTIFRIQMVLGACRVDARDRFMTAPTIYQRLYTAILSVITILVSVTTFFAYINEFYTADSKTYDLCVAAQVIHIATYSSNIIHVRFMNRDANVKFYFKMQEIDKRMKIENNKTINAILRETNNTTVKVLVVTFFVIFLIAITRGVLMVLGFVGIAVSHSVFIIEMSYCSNLMTYFYIRTRFINSIIANHIKSPKADNANELIDEVKVPKKNFQSKAHMRWLVAQTHNFITSETDVYLKELFNCFSIFQEIHKFQILVFFFTSAALLLLSIEFGISAIQTNNLPYQEWIIIITIVTVSILHATFISIRCQMFYSEVIETKRLSVAIMSQYFEGPLREKAKNMLHMIETTPPYFSVYDMWTLDTRVMVKVFSILTALVFTQFQFAFL